MSAKPPRKKPKGKAKKPLAVPPLGSDAKAAESIPKQKEAELAHLPFAYSTSADTLWADFEETACDLVRLFNVTPETLDSARLRTVTRACLYMLRKTIKLGGDKAEEAVSTLFSATQRGCEILAEASKDEKSREALSTIAPVMPEWPVMLSLIPNSYEEAKTYLADIGVGTDSILPTATMRDSEEKRWRQLAVMLIEKIYSSRGLLEMQARKERSTSPSRQRAIEEKGLPRASEWKQEVLNLPLELNTQTASKWWEVATDMLKAHWEKYPAEKKAVFEKVKISAKPCRAFRHPLTSSALAQSFSFLSLSTSF